MSQNSSQINFLDSFPFLDLPGEIRNIVYDLLLCSDDPIRALAPQFGLRWANSRIREAIPFLRTCRRIHAEAAGFLYTRNSFQILFTDIDFNSWAGQSTSSIDVWLRVLNGKSEKISSLELLIQTFAVRIRQGRQGDVPSLELLPLLRHLWSGKMNPGSVRFNCCWREPEDLEIAQRLNQILSALVEDHIHIKRFSKFARLLKSVNIELTGMSLDVQYFGETPNSAVEQRTTNIIYRLMDGQLTRQSEPLSLESLLDHKAIHGNIMSHLPPPPLDFTIDLSKHTITPAPGSLHALNHVTRGRFLLPNTNMSATINVATNGTTLSFTGDLSYPEIWTDCIRALPRLANRFDIRLVNRIQLEFKLIDAHSHADLRFDATSLVRLMNTSTAFEGVNTITVKTFQEDNLLHSEDFDLLSLADNIIIAVDRFLSEKYTGLNLMSMSAWADGNGRIREIRSGSEIYQKSEQMASFLDAPQDPYLTAGEIMSMWQTAYDRTRWAHFGTTWALRSPLATEQFCYAPFRGFDNHISIDYATCRARFCSDQGWDEEADIKTATAWQVWSWRQWGLNQAKQNRKVRNWWHAEELPWPGEEEQIQIAKSRNWYGEMSFADVWVSSEA